LKANQRRVSPSGRTGMIHPIGVMQLALLRVNVVREERRSGVPSRGWQNALEEGAVMANTQVDELGPVDYIVVEFPGSKFSGEIAPALRDLVERGLVRVLDLLVIKKEQDGTVDAFELSDLDDTEIGELRRHEGDLAMLLSEDDVKAVAAAVEPGSSAGVLVWENSWAAPFASAVRHSGGQLVASGRIPIQALAAAVEADEDHDTEGA
jgi:hypothetical protein